MIRALAFRNLRNHSRLIAALAGGVFFLEILIVLIAAAFGEDPAFLQTYNAVPPIIQNLSQALIGMRVEELSFAFFVSFGFQHPAAMAMGIALTVLITTVPASERESGFLDLVLAHPVSRTRYLTATLVTLLVCACLLPAAQLTGAAIGLSLVEIQNEPSWLRYAPNALGQTALYLAFGGLTLWLCSRANRRGTAASYSVGVILILFIIEALGNLYEPLETIRWISLFHYFRPILIILSGPSWTDPLILLLVFAVSTGPAFVYFSRRDV